jgi:hypothetical protein
MTACGVRIVSTSATLHSHPSTAPRHLRPSPAPLRRELGELGNTRRRVGVGATRGYTTDWSSDWGNEGWDSATNQAGASPLYHTVHGEPPHTSVATALSLYVDPLSKAPTSEQRRKPYVGGLASGRSLSDGGGGACRRVSAAAAQRGQQPGGEECGGWRGCGAWRRGRARRRLARGAVGRAVGDARRGCGGWRGDRATAADGWCWCTGARHTRDGERRCETQ